MDTNKDSAGSYSVWLPGSALILSLVISAFALTRDPFLEIRPVGGQFPPQTPIEARLWQDPFDALERYRKRINEKGNVTSPPAPCAQVQPKKPAQLLVALVEEGAYAEAVELRRRMRYAILAGLKNARLMPEDEQHIRCFTMPADFTKGAVTDSPGNKVEILYESFVPNPFEPRIDSDEQPPPYETVHLLWLKQDALRRDPLGKLEKMRTSLVEDEQKDTLKVIGPADSAVLRELYLQEAKARYGKDKIKVEIKNENMEIKEVKEERNVVVPQLIEIYSPLATADRNLLMRGFSHEGLVKAHQFKSLKLLRTVSDDAKLSQLLLEELKLRRVDPTTGAGCATPDDERKCFPGTDWRSANRVALISEWDSFYSRALIESFSARVGKRSEPPDIAPSRVDQWVLRFSYLRGLDGRLPEDAITKTGQKPEKEHRELNFSPLEKSDGNSQLDYLRRLADHIQQQDQAYRRANKSGIGAIGVMGLDTYDKLLVLQALKSRMPNKLYFSTDLDARMLQREQSQITRNLVLAAPYGLTLTSALQQDVPPFRDSQQSAVFIAVLAALSPQTFEAKRLKFDYSSSGLLSPSIYEVGMSGFIPLDSKSTQQRSPNCAPASSNGNNIRQQDIMSLRCLQDPSPPLYPQASQALKDRISSTQSFFLAGPLVMVLLIVGSLVGWWHSVFRQARKENVAWVPLALYGTAALIAWITTRTWQVELMWVAFGLVLLAVIVSSLIRRFLYRKAAADKVIGLKGTFDSNAWYVLVPLATYVLALLGAYQIRDVLTENGLGEPMFLFEGISAWPSLALRLLAVIISVSALLWGWRSLHLNRQQIEREIHLGKLMQRYQIGHWQQRPRLTSNGKLRPLNQLAEEFGQWFNNIFLPLTSQISDKAYDRRLLRFAGTDPRPPGLFKVYWREHCMCGSFGARLIRAALLTWIFLVITSLLFVLWPMDSDPIRGTLQLRFWSWLPSTLAFNFLVFWVVDANWLLTRFIRQLSNDFSIWPRGLRLEHKRIFGQPTHPCIDELAGLTLVAKRTAAVSRLIYAPTIVLVILIVSRSSLFDNWSTPPSMIIMFVLNGVILLSSALSLRRAAERARTAGLQRVDRYLLETPESSAKYSKFRLIRERIVALNSGAFSRYADEPLVRALLLALTGIGGSAIVDALNFAKF
ncbi:hypothetical protein P5705_24280 [Pseudomonas entomophila]|uniref:hypothetical protein n=1 Tax=Pseudomonas entomophila TaxID=312306 RepID=UPI00240595BF|nr:hypothetical protein [Pseudomonas entomophila]MDF9620776.1 hypothetical protein [Pseudomonas entomophila]